MAAEWLEIKYDFILPADIVDDGHERGFLLWAIGRVMVHLSWQQNGYLFSPDIVWTA